MASLIPSILSKDVHTQIFIVGATLVVLIGFIFAITLFRGKEDEENPSTFTSFLRFFYASFLKPHTGDGAGGQQDALESFYKAQAGVYDATRKRLLRGREDMLGLVAAQLVQKAAKNRTHDPKRIWVDVSAPLLLCRLHKLTRYVGRSVVVQDGTSKRCPNLSPFQNSSPVSTLSTSLPPSAKLPESDSQDWAGQT
jgi:hypothetical protein